MRRHAKSCWGEEAVTKADEMGSAEGVRKAFVEKQGGLRNGNISMMFERKKGVITYSHRAHTRTEAR